MNNRINNLDDKHADAHKVDGHEVDAHGAGVGGSHGHAGGSHAAHAEHGGEHHHEEYSNDPEGAMKYWLNADHLIAHVQDSDRFEWFGYDELGNKNSIKIPHISPFTNERPAFGENGVLISHKHSDFLGPTTFQPTKFVIVELLAALIVSMLGACELMSPSSASTT